MTTSGLSVLERRHVPTFPGFWAVLGPGIIWMALAQGSGELIWWPYLIAKYGLTFLFLLIPACLLQYPLTVEIGRYTLLTGESIFHGFIRLHRGLGVFLWLLMSISFLWFGAFAAAGGTALAALTDFPADWGQRGQTLFWGYLSIAVFFTAIVLSRVIYILIERVMKIVAVLTVAGLIWACLQPEVLGSVPEFLRGMVAPPAGSMPQVWEDADATKLLTAITFAGLGGFWILFYSYWLRDKGAAMAAYNGRLTGLITGNPETINTDGTLPLDTEEDKSRWRVWLRYLRTESLIGICGNLLTTLMTCLLAFALLYPKGLLPQDYDLAVVQSRFFEVSWGTPGRILFLLVAAAFLADTWLATVDAVSRMQADILHILFPRARRFSQRYWYYLFLFVLTAVTCFTMPLSTPGTLIMLSAVIGFAGTVIFPAALYFLNHRLLIRQLPVWAQPSGIAGILLATSFVFYALLALAYTIALLR